MALAWLGLAFSLIDIVIGLLLLPLSVQGSFFSRIDALLGGLEWEVESMLRELCSHFVGIFRWDILLGYFVGIFCWDKIFKKLHLKQYPRNAVGAMLKFCWDKI